jgi:signal transduction histidine kinase/serine/threonine protein kinase
VTEADTVVRLPADASGDDVLDGRYVLGVVVRTDATGVTHHAHDRILGRDVAVIVLAGDGARGLGSLSDPAVTAVMALDHPNVASVYDVGVEGERAFVVTELVAGTSVAELVARRGAQPPARALAIARGICAGLAALHRHGAGHGDVVPSNVVVGRDGVVRLIVLPVAGPGACLGVEAGDDVRAVGAVLYELLTGASPGVPPAPVRRSNSAVSRPLEALVQDALTGQLEPASRSVELLERACAEEAQSDVARPRTGVPPRRSFPPPWPPPPPRLEEAATSRRRSSLALRLGVAVALAAAVALFVVAALAVRSTRSSLTDDLSRRLTSVVSSFRDGPSKDITDPSQLAPAARAWLSAQPDPPDQLSAVHTVDGTTLTTRGSLDLREAPGWAELLTATRSGWTRLHTSNGDVVALAVPLQAGGQQVGTLVAAGSLRPVDAAVGGLQRRVIWACLAGFLVAVGLAVLAVRRTLGPLHRMAAEVDGFQAVGDLSRRVNVMASHDEVGRLATAFNRMLARLESVFSSQRRFMAEASHELRTPLTVARGQVELIDPERLDQESQRSRALALGELDRMGRIIGDLLLLARLDEDIPFRKARVEIELVVREALLRCGATSTDAVTVDVDDDLAAVADFERVLQVFTNVLGNALRYGGPLVEVTVRARRSGPRVVVEVADNGPGISADDQERLFERFFRGNVAKPGDGGAGLGLPIALRLVERMGGTLTLSSELGRGTSVQVDLPAAPGPE